MKDFILFRKMITPWLLQLLFWVSVIIFIIVAIVDIIHQVNWRVVLEILVLGPLASRIVCEVLILVFRINNNLTEINNKLKEFSLSSAGIPSEPKNQNMLE